MGSEKEIEAAHSLSSEKHIPNNLDGYHRCYLSDPRPSRVRQQQLLLDARVPPKRGRRRHRHEDRVDVRYRAELPCGQGVPGGPELCGLHRPGRPRADSKSHGEGLRRGILGDGTMYARLDGRVIVQVRSVGRAHRGGKLSRRQIFLHQDRGRARPSARKREDTLLQQAFVLKLR